MELLLNRTYYPTGTNGLLYINGKLQCYTIELPWLNNKQGVSCIPEGKYLLSFRYTLRLGNHLRVEGVPERSDILIHPANDALKELRGCIATVTFLTGVGKGNDSRKALYKILEILQQEQRLPHFLKIQKILI